MKNAFLVTLLAFVFVGCASIIKGGHQEVPINSDPSSASIIVYNVRTGMEVAHGVTPSTITLKRGCGYFKKCKYRVVLEKDGYVKREVVLEGSPNGWYIGGNILIGGLIGWLIVDPATGAMWTLKPDAINEKIQETAGLPQAEGLHIVLVPKDRLPTIIYKELQVVN